MTIADARVERAIACPHALLAIDGKPERIVKNLGWLLHNWRQIESFEMTSIAGVTCLHNPGAELVLVAWLAHRGQPYHGTFATAYASEYVCLTLFLDRPVFRGLPARLLNGQTLDIGSAAYHSVVTSHPHHTPKP